jgi:acetyl esterase/lipase
VTATGLSSEDILSLVPPAADKRLAYGTDANQFGDLRLPKSRGPHPVAVNLHGGYWRNKYSLEHAGHLCVALAAKGVATWNLEYRRVGDPGGGWPGTFEDVLSGFRYVRQIAQQYGLDAGRCAVMGHSAGGQLALCLAARENGLRGIVSLAGVLDLERAWRLHLSNDAVVEFLGGTPEQVADHYHEADPKQLAVARAPQRIIHGKDDDVVPPDFSRDYVAAKKKRGESVELLELDQCGHFEVIDPRSPAWPRIEQVVLKLLG